MLDAYLDLGELDLPVMIMPMPVTGTTGPAGLLANVALANAEALSAIVVFQLAHPGRPVIYSSATGSMDFRTGAFLGGTPEMGIMSAALVTMGRSYGLPATAAGCTSDAPEPGPEAVIEKLVTMLPPASAGADIVVGLGEIQGDQALVLEQILVDNELGRYVERLVEGIGEPADPDFVEEVLGVGPGGNFLASPVTRRAARSREFLAPSLVGRHAYEAWRDLGSPSMYGRARDRVREILAGPASTRFPTRSRRSSPASSRRPTPTSADRRRAPETARALRRGWPSAPGAGDQASGSTKRRALPMAGQTRRWLRATSWARWLRSW